MLPCSNYTQMVLYQYVCDLQCLLRKNILKEAFMEFLKWLEPLRTPLLDPVISVITHMGDETFFMIVGMLILW